MTLTVGDRSNRIDSNRDSVRVYEYREFAFGLLHSSRRQTNDGSEQWQRRLWRPYQSNRRQLRGDRDNSGSGCSNNNAVWQRGVAMEATPRTGSPEVAGKGAAASNTGLKGARTGWVSAAGSQFVLGTAGACRPLHIGNKLHHRLSPKFSARSLGREQSLLQPVPRGRCREDQSQRTGGRRPGLAAIRIR